MRRRRGPPELDPRKTVLLAQSPPDEAAGALSPEACAVEVIEYRPRRVRIQVRSDGHGYLVLGDAWSSEWTASVDGRPSTIYRANVACRAIRIEPGEHLVEFRHNARMLLGGLLLGGVSLVMLCLLWAVGLIRSRKHTRSASEPVC